ncbi:MAG: choice-of-anchor L domain-containing protein [Polyangiaceae bacterium]
MTGGGGSGGVTMTTTTTPVEDEDGDGWKVSDGDCCDSAAAGCSQKPELVNPGALEYPGDGVDNDCNPATLDSDPYPTCSTKMAADADIAAQAVISSTKLVKAMDLCQFTQEAPALPQKTWGVISSKITLADGTDAVAPKNIQMGVLPSFGPNVMPQYGETMAAIATGTARREGDPGYIHPQNGPMAGQTGNYNAATSCPAPPDYVAANGGQVPSPCGNCVGPNCVVAYDSVALRIRLRPPTNAKSFSYRFDFYSAEYPEFLCQDYNDYFVALLTGNPAPEIPADGNIAFDAQNNPVSVNNSFFDVCFPAVGSPPGSCSGGTLGLVGNGMGGWSGSITDGGATGWLQNDVPLQLKQNPNDPNNMMNKIPTAAPIEIQFTIWDAGDHNVDSLVLLDRFRWNLEPAVLLTHQ